MSAIRHARALCLAMLVAAASASCSWNWGRFRPGASDGGVACTGGCPAACGADARCVTPIAIALGGAHTCTAMDDHTVYCWGMNTSHQLAGDANTPRPLPGPVPGLTGVVRVAAGFAHTCALTSGGAVFCWGINDLGELGDGTSTNRGEPTPVVGLGSDVQDIVASTAHTCARKSDGSLWCWGNNNSGQIGDGMQTVRDAGPPGQLMPVEVSALTRPVVHVCTGSDHTCAVDDQHQLWCWGTNSSGQLGVPSIPRSSVPRQVAAMTAFADVACSDNHSCAITSSGDVFCWGDNAHGEASPGAAAGTVMTPTQVTGVSGAQHIVLGNGRSCAIVRDYAVLCWGENDHGQLGDGTTMQPTAPVGVHGLGVLAELALGGAHTCALTADGYVSCWGENDNGQLGDGTLDARSRPVAVHW